MSDDRNFQSGWVDGHFVDQMKPGQLPKAEEELARVRRRNDVLTIGIAETTLRAETAEAESAALREEINKLTLLSGSQLANQERLTEELAQVREENIKLLNDASVWRNRAIGAEEEIREGGRGIDLRRGFER